MTSRTKPKTVAIIDYEMGNMFSVQQACKHVGLVPSLTSDAEEIMAADAAILPGVGAFGDAMHNLRRLDLIHPIKDFIASGKPFFGICLGMQLLFTESEEFGSYEGLDIVNGSVKKFQSKNSKSGKVKVPQIGWNQIYYCGQKDSLYVYEGVKNGEYMFFVHSYYVCPSNAEHIATKTTYEGYDYCSSVISENVFASQFHPEKSAVEGIKIYQNWAEKIN